MNQLVQSPRSPSLSSVLESPSLSSAVLESKAKSSVVLPGKQGVKDVYQDNENIALKGMAQEVKKKTYEICWVESKFQKHKPSIDRVRYSELRKQRNKYQKMGAIMYDDGMDNVMIPDSETI